MAIRMLRAVSSAFGRFDQGDTIAGLTPQQEAQLVADGDAVDAGGGLYAAGEASPVVTLTATGTAFTGACEFGGYFCRVPAGTITIYDATSATGTPIVPTTTLTVGAMPWMGPGTTQRRVNSAGVHVVLSGAATVDILVA